MTAAAASSSPPTPEPLLDLPGIMLAIRRRRRWWLSAALLGLLAGALLAVLAPPQPTAVTRLLIVHEDDQPTDGGTLMKTDIALLETTRIASAALQRLNSTERPEDFLKTYEGTGLTNNVLELKVKGTSDGDAVARAGALADAFIADHVTRVKAAAEADAKALIAQRDRAQAELTQVDAAITAASQADRDDAATELESLYARRAELTAQVSDLGRRAEQAGIGAPRVAAGTQIVGAPRAIPGSPLRTGVVNAVVGLVLGLTVGLALAAVSGVVRDRPVLRREIAAHLGASVIAQLPTARRGPALPWRRSRRAAERRRVAMTLVRAVRNDRADDRADDRPDDRPLVSVLELGSPRTAAELAMDMAAELATDGPVVVVDDLPGGHLRGLAGKTPGPIRIVDGGESGHGSEGTVVARHGPAGQPERQIGVGSVAPATAWTDLQRLGPQTLLVVRAGHANTRWLHTVARQLADLQIPVIGVVLVDPDPRDRSDGTLWDGLHTALRGRARWSANPAGPVASAGTATGDRTPLNGAVSAAVTPTVPPTGDLTTPFGRRVED